MDALFFPFYERLKAQRCNPWRLSDIRSVQMGMSRKKLVIDTDPGIGEQASNISGADSEDHNGISSHTTLLKCR